MTEDEGFLFLIRRWDTVSKHTGHNLPEQVAGISVILLAGYGFVTGQRTEDENLRGRANQWGETVFSYFFH